ncbi:Hint domain-containing protein [Cognatishimia maritima]|uniref:Hint domain-containing protein n=1 Tax=Cognatishimia maritima TaxID=870908 RepID=A0A1M5U6F0_9RHOB|nr:Hint domain-containing protein [Cognatishimia maritima]SHH58471.1 Hint domain-containing protein [Cognatishimia maritima]
MANSYAARFDSNTGGDTKLNLTNDAAQTINFVSDSGGDVVLEPNGGEADPDTLIEIGGQSYNFTYEMSATLPASTNDGAGKVPDEYEDSEVYVVTVHDYPSAGETTRLVFMPDEEASLDDMDSFQNGAIKLQNANTTESAAVCFAEGTLIDTDKGYVRIETLATGAMVRTLDQGFQPIVWISQTTHEWPGSEESYLPIEIRSGAMDGDLPMKDLVVSPQHRVLIQNSKAGPNGALAPAKGMLEKSGVRLMQGKKRITYYHLLLPAHSVVFANGLPCESFYPGEEALKALTKTQRIDLLRALSKSGCFDLRDYGAFARPVLSVQETRDLFDPDNVFHAA